MSYLFAILLFSFLIFVHELGHFLAAKAFGVQVNEFSVFMGPAIFKKRVGETLYSIRCIPIASTIVTIAGSPSGIAATARLTEVINIGNGGCLRKSPIPKIMPQIISAPMPSSLPVSPSFFCKGVSRSSCSAKRAAIFPISVAMPVAVTATVPLPART